MISQSSLQPLKQLLLVGSLMLGSLSATAADKVVVMTSYPQEVISHVESAFEKAYPDYTLEIIWKQSNDALAFIQNNRQQVDVYWTPSRNNFIELSKAGYLLKLDLKANEKITNATVLNGLQLNDPDGYYMATEIAGLGMVINPAAIKQLNLNSPSDWGDLTHQHYQKKIALPIPSKIGFATGLLEAMLQGKTWDEGWRVILGVSTNANLIGSGSTFITEEVASGKQAVGITMDFFAASAIAKGAPLTYVYPPHVSYSPAHVALLKDAPNMAGAKTFLEWTLSAQGQTLLFHPDIRKLPVNASVYAHKPAGYFNPFEHANQTHSTPRNLTQQLVLNSLFDAMVTNHHAKLVALYSQYRQAELASPEDARLAEVFSLIASPILSAQEANTPAILHAFSMRKKQADAEKQARAYTSAWSALALERYEKAERILHTLLAD